MNSNKEKFLRENVGFHFEDLSLIRQVELERVVKELGVSPEWMFLALSRNPIEKWEEWGFGLFYKQEFKVNVDALERAINSMSEETFKRENNRKNQKKPQLWVDNKTFYKVWNGVKAQGRTINA